ncbi:MAG: hypothetical protein HC859_14485 [Bacteroidia bacterium]|nr:hypothetical protein [Bacteroidia bacterium]
MKNPTPSGYTRCTAYNSAGLNWAQASGSTPTTSGAWAHSMALPSFDFARIRANAFFLQANYGYADGVKLRGVEGSGDLNTRGGAFTNALVGYRIDVSKKASMIVAAGWRSQVLSYSYSYQWTSQTKYDVTETLNRVELRIGFGFR